MSRIRWVEHILQAAEWITRLPELLPRLAAVVLSPGIVPLPLTPRFVFQGIRQGLFQQRDNKVLLWQSHPKASLLPGAPGWCWSAAPDLWENTTFQNISRSQLQILARAKAASAAARKNISSTGKASKSIRLNSKQDPQLVLAARSQSCPQSSFGPFLAEDEI